MCPFKNHRLHCALFLTLSLVWLGTSTAEELAMASQDWPQWRGPNRDGVNPEKGLANQWPEGGPKLLYKATGVGVGFSSVVIADGTLYTLGDLADACYLFALDLKGKHKWKARVGDPKGHRGYPGPRSTPTVVGGHVHCLGQHSDLVCITTAGKEVWRVLGDYDWGSKNARAAIDAAIAG